MSSGQSSNFNVCAECAVSADHDSDYYCVDATTCPQAARPVARQSTQRAKSRGQGFVEYALIILFVALVVVAALTLLGPLVSSVFTRIQPAL